MNASRLKIVPGFLFCGMLLLLECASAPSAPQAVSEIPQGHLRRPSIGVSLAFSKKKIRIIQAGPAVRDAGLRKGDILLSLNERDLARRGDLIRILNELRPGDTVSITALRKRDTLRTLVALSAQDYREDVDFIIRQLWREAPLNLAIMTGSFSNSTLANKKKLQQWQEGAQAEILASTENFFINVFKNEKNFSIIDRRKVKNILQEKDLNQSEFIADNLRQKLGSMLGTTHILSVEYSVSENDEIITHRLIEAGTGVVLVSIVFNPKKVGTFNFLRLLFPEQQITFS